MDHNGNGTLASGEPTKLSDAALETYGHSLATRFQMRLVDQARSGHFGVLKSRNVQMRQSFEKLAVMLPHRRVPIFVFGDCGTGKRRLVSEFHSLQSFLDRLNGRAGGRLHVLRGDYLQPGFVREWNRALDSSDMVYVESLEDLSLPVQAELLRALASDSLTCRLVLSTAVALSLKVAQGGFLRELFAEISEVSVYLPSLHDRPEDLPQITAEMIHDLSAGKTMPSPRIMDVLTRADLPKNLDDLETLLRCMLSKKFSPAEWTLEDFPPAFRALFPAHLLSSDGGKASLVTHRKQMSLIQRALLESGGSRSQAAQRLGMNKAELIQKMLSLGIR